MMLMPADLVVRAKMIATTSSPAASIRATAAAFRVLHEKTRSAAWPSHRTQRWLSRCVDQRPSSPSPMRQSASGPVPDLGIP